MDLAIPPVGSRRSRVRRLGVSFDVNFSSTTFAAFPLSNPPQCSYATTPACPFATLGPLSNAPLGATVSETASESGPSPGVLGIRPTTNSGPFACPGSHPDGATAFSYGSGLEAPSNDYNISPGLPNSAWKVGVSPIPNDCSTSEPTVAGGPSGFGLMETLLGPETSGYGTLRYRPFDTATMTFDKPALPVVSPGVGASVQLGQDGSGRIYAAMYLSLPPQLLSGPHPPGSLRALVYSADGGHTWHGPGPLQPDIVPDSSTLPMARRSAPTARAGSSGRRAPPCRPSSSRLPTPTRRSRPRWRHHRWRRARASRSR